MVYSQVVVREKMKAWYVQNSGVSPELASPRRFFICSLG
jgi:hypothetical protein